MRPNLYPYILLFFLVNFLVYFFFVNDWIGSIFNPIITFKIFYSIFIIAYFSIIIFYPSTPGIPFFN